MPNKALAGTGGLTFSGALAFLIIKLWWKDADAETAIALTTVISGLITFPSIYFTPHN